MGGVQTIRMSAALIFLTLWGPFFTRGSGVRTGAYFHRGIAYMLASNATADPAKLFDYLARQKEFSTFNWSYRPEQLYMYSDGSKVPAMANEACLVLFITGLACDHGAVIEMGSWLGASTRCLAAGLAVNGCNPDFQVLDRFEPSQLYKLKGTRYANATVKEFDMLSVWKQTVHEINRHVQPVVIKDLNQLDREIPPTTWQQGVQVFVIDSAKSTKKLMMQSRFVWEHLFVGSVVHLMDFMESDQVDFVAMVLLPRNLFGIEYIQFGSSPWAFTVLSPLSLTNFEEYFYSNISCASRDSAYKNLLIAVSSHAQKTKPGRLSYSLTRRQILSWKRLFL